MASPRLCISRRCGSRTSRSRPGLGRLCTPIPTLLKAIPGRSVGSHTVHHAPISDRTGDGCLRQPFSAGRHELSEGDDDRVRRTRGSRRYERSLRRPVLVALRGWRRIWLVRWNGRIFETLAARRERREAYDLDHSALAVRLGPDRFVIEMGPAWGNGQVDRGVVSEGPVGLPRLGRSRIFRYEVRPMAERQHSGRVRSRSQPAAHEFGRLSRAAVAGARPCLSDRHVGP